MDPSILIPTYSHEMDGSKANFWGGDVGEGGKERVWVGQERRRSRKRRNGGRGYLGNIELKNRAFRGLHLKVCL